MSNHFPIKNSPGCLESLALNESTDFASKNFILFAKVLRSLLAPRWTLHQVGSSPNFENFQINKRMGLTHPFIYEKTPQVGLEPTTYRLTAGCSAIELLRIIFSLIN